MRLAGRGAARAGGFGEPEDWAWIGFAVAMVLSAAVLLWEARDITFQADELTYFLYFHDFDLTSLLTPQNAHLILVPRLIYAAVFQTVGPAHAALEVVEALGVLLCGGLFFLLAKRRVGGVVALALTLPLLFFGSSYDTVLVSLGIPFVYSLAAGLGALLALERRDTRGDVAACPLLLLALASHSLGFAFLLGAAVAVLVPADRRRRAWIFLLPLLAYGAWWVWALRFHQSSIEHASNFWLIPKYTADSLAAVTSSVTGLDYPIGSNLQSSPIDIGWGRVLGVVGVAGLWWRLRRGDVALSLWVVLAVLLAFWALLAIQASPTSNPEQTRYLYPGAVLLLLLVAEAARGVRFSRLGVLVLFGAVAVSVAANLKILSDASTERSDFAAQARSELAMVELSRGHVDPGLVLSDASRDLQEEHVQFPVSAGPYLAAVDDIGSFAFSPQQVLQQDEPVREGADFMLAQALGLKLESSHRPTSLRGCKEERQRAGPAGVFAVPRGGAVVGLSGAPPAQMELRRFADSYTVPFDVPPGSKWLVLRIPSDSVPQPWAAAISSPAPLTVCPLPS